MSIIIYEEDLEKHLRLRQIMHQLYGKNPKMNVYYIKDAEEGLKYMAKEYIDAAFISWEDKWGKGLFLSEKLKQRNYRLNIIVMSEEYRFMEEFWKWHMSGYIIGKITREKVLDELQNLRYA